MSDKIIIFDTTLRDGEQCPGASMNLREKMEVARQLARVNVDVIEAGFPVSSPGDFESVQTIATEIRGPVICGLARCAEKDIDAAGAAVKPAGERGRIHVFLATSAIHREFKLKKATEEIIRMTVEGVKRARALVKALEHSTKVSARMPEGGMFVMVDVRKTGLSGEEFARSLLAEENVVTMPGESFGAGGAGHLRVALTVSVEDITEACKRIARLAERI